jgi:hypothetical protein
MSTKYPLLRIFQKISRYLYYLQRLRQQKENCHTDIQCIAT